MSVELGSAEDGVKNVNKYVDSAVDDDGDVTCTTAGDEVDDNAVFDSLFSALVVYSPLELFVGEWMVTFVTLSVAFVAGNVTDVVIVDIGVDPNADDSCIFVVDDDVTFVEEFVIVEVPKDVLEGGVAPAGSVDNVADDGNTGNKVEDGVANSVADFVTLATAEVALLAVGKIVDVAVVVVTDGVVVVVVADDSDDALVGVVVVVVDNDDSVVINTVGVTDDEDRVVVNVVLIDDVVNVVVDRVEEDIVEEEIDVDEDELENVVGVVTGADEEVDALEFVTFEADVVKFSDDVSDVDALMVNKKLLEKVSLSTIVELKDPAKCGATVNVDCSAVVIWSSTLRRTMRRELDEPVSNNNNSR